MEDGVKNQGVRVEGDHEVRERQAHHENITWEKKERRQAP